MPKFLERKLKKEYGANSSVPYKIMNKMGAMHGNKVTKKGEAMEEKHEKKMGLKDNKTEEKAEKFKGKGTRARLNTAAEKHMFGSKYSK
jgi:hypothetical protein